MSGRDLRSFVTTHRIADAGISGWSRIFFNFFISSMAGK